MSAHQLTIRTAEESDALAIIEAHHAAIREKAASHYSSAIISAWAPDEITDDKIQKLRNDMRDPDFYVIVAEIKETIIGFGMVIPRRNELRAVYVRNNPCKGVGDRLVKQLIDHAKGQGAKFLEIDGSINAETFYSKAGFKILEHGTHRLQSGADMACVKMRLDF